MAEILAPLPDIWMSQKILTAGADRLVTGLRSFSREATGATAEERDLLDFARDNPGTAERIHVALNVVAPESAWEAITESVKALIGGGYRNFIVNEHGLLHVISRTFPQANLCGSVGLSATNPYDALFLERLGASAMVMPLMSSPGDIRGIKRISSIAVEVFAICRAEPITQGKCMLAGYLLARDAATGETPLLSSKKTGLCYTVCRTILGSYPEHDITGNIGDWVDAGVDIFKIEGRYRKLDEIIAMVKKVREALSKAGK
jgi:putative protease